MSPGEASFLAGNVGLCPLSFFARTTISVAFYLDCVLRAGKIFARLEESAIDKKDKTRRVTAAAHSLLIFEHGAVQKSRSMDYPQNVNCLSADAKHASIIFVKQMSVARAKDFIFRNEGTSFGKPLQRRDLVFQPVDKSTGSLRAILRDKTPNVLYVPLRRARDSNAASCGHV